MSGVGEVIAIVSCVAGLIEALDAGHRIVKEIKKRRQAHRSNGALPPSDQLEKTLGQGKEDIEQLVEKGRRRFGENFEADETAQLAIMKVTIQIQNALLHRLTQARSDDGVIDFEECINLSDQGCNDALVALRALYQRKLQEDMGRKRRTSSIQGTDKAEAETTKAQPTVEVNALKPKKDIEANTSEPRTPIEVVIPSRPAPSRKSTKTFPFMRKSFAEGDKDLPKPPLSPEGVVSSPTLNMSPRRDTMYPERSSFGKSSKRPSLSSESSYSPTIAASIHNNAESTWVKSMSRSTTIATVTSMTPTIPTLAQYNGTCKYAHRTRESGYKAGLSPVNLATYASNWIYQCQSSKCRFDVKALNDKKGLRIDDRISQRYGIQYRATFLAKSHIAYKDNTSEWPFLCLICLFLYHESEIHNGIDNLFQHIADHKELNIGPNNVPLEGPLSFSNVDVKITSDFDINLPDLPSPPTSPEVQHGPVRLFDEIKKQLGQLASQPDAKNTDRDYTLREDHRAQTDPFENPWAS